MRTQRTRKGPPPHKDPKRVAALEERRKKRQELRELAKPVEPKGTTLDVEAFEVDADD